jgi:hypothetical protein
VTDPTTHTCARCDRPMRHDTALLCHGCGRVLAKALLGAASLGVEVETTIARLEELDRAGVGRPDEDGWERNGDALEPIALPLSLVAMASRDAVVGELSTWVRHIAAERGIDVPSASTGRAIGILAVWLTGHVDWLRHRPNADEAVLALLDACAQTRRIVDSRPDGLLVCMCACSTRVYAQPGDHVATCTECGTAYDVETARADLLDQARELAYTPAEAADLISSWVDPYADRRKVRDLVRQWAHRGLIEGDEDGRYRLGPILDRWTRALAARVA